MGSVTAGNSSGVTDGAAALLLAGRSAAERLDIPMQARLIDYAVVGVEPQIMGAGPVPAIRKLLARTNLYGGGSLGHPPGATGLRMTITAMHHLADTKGRYAIIGMCLGSGMGMASLIENLQR